MKKTLKIAALMISYLVMAASVASASWASGSAIVSDSAHLIVLGVSLIATGSLLRGRMEKEDLDDKNRDDKK
jgi:hypothetical protein